MGELRLCMHSGLKAVAESSKSGTEAFPVRRNRKNLVYSFLILSEQII